MKKLLFLFLLLTGVIYSYAQDPEYPAAPAAVQNITAAEYFIDNDPGFGNGTPIAVTPGVNISNAPAAINVNGLSNGIHRLYIRTRNAAGVWSIVSAREFLYDADVVYTAPPAAAQNIVAAEYFIDTDPGFGMGTAIAVTPGVNVAGASATINTAGLSNGIHRLYIRTRSAEGRWSMNSVRDFVVDFDFAYPASPVAAQNVVAAEYFIDTDPGIGSATAIPVTAGSDLSNISAAINTSSLSTGTHRLYIRTRNAEGRWSLTHFREFITDTNPAYPASPVAAQNVVAAEYFIDTDPGIGSATAIPVTAGGDLNNITATINTTGIATGTHRLYIRTKNAEGRWSMTNVKEFITDIDPAYATAPAAAQNIVAAEYFIDTDPGAGGGTAVSVTPGVNISNMSVAVNTATLSNGSHRLYLRTRSAEGRWSITNTDTFYVGVLSLSADTLLFGSVPVSNTVIKKLAITNQSATTQTITGITVAAPFTTDFAGTITLAPGTTDTVKVNFTPVAVQPYQQTMVLQTSAGNLDVVLKGTGIAQVATWTIDPAGGHNFGAVAVNSTANYNLTIRNPGNIDITLSSVTVNNAAFVPAFTAGTVIAAGGAITIPVAFTPTAVSAYSGQFTINSSTNGVSAVTTVVTGNGYMPGTAPVLQWISAAPYSSNGVYPAVGQTGIFTYKVLYTSADNKAPQAGYPKVGIDLNGDHDFDDLGEGIFNMVKEGNSNDYTTGVVYSYTFQHTANTSTAGYQFFAVDNNGNAATATAYKSGPVVTSDQLDLRIFANDISFSKNNPQPGESFTLTANVSNSSAYPATNVPVRFYRDTILLDSAIIPAVNAFGSASISKVFSFAAEGFYPIKVWIDSSNTLNDANVLNNYAIRPVTVGSPLLPGGITATTGASYQQCPRPSLLISGNAVYFGTGSATAVAGAEVTINTGTQVIHTTTDANGNYSYLFSGVDCGGNLTYMVTVTDFTFTSSPVTNTIAVPCPAANLCSPPPSQGGMSATFSTSPCSNKVGSSGNMNFIVEYRSRDVNNMWSLFDEITNDKLEIFQDGVLVQTITSYDGSHSPGEQRVIPVTFPLNTAAPVDIRGVLTYTYVEYREIPSSLYHGIRTAMSATGGGTIRPELNQPDLTIQQFAQTGFKAFSFNDANIKCGDAGAHTVKIFDAVSGGPFNLVKTTTVNSLAGGTAIGISFNDPSLAPGTHTIRIVTDADGTVDEQDENNNVFETTIVVPFPDLSIPKIKASNTALSVGSAVKFIATVKNTGSAAGEFYVQFNVNGVQVGAKKKVSFVNENESVTVISDDYIVTTADNVCGTAIEAIADVDGAITESDESNNSRQIVFASDLAPYQLPGEVGSASNPAVVRVNTTNQFFPAIRNIGERDVSNVSVRFMLGSNWIGADALATVKAGEVYAAHAAFTQMFTVPGDYVVQVIADTANTICESDENNNTGSFYIRVVDTKPDLEVLSQYISPSSLNPNLAQAITIVGTVRNSGGKPTTPNKLRFLVDDIQLGDDVPIGVILPGKDTTVQATALYSSIISGVKVMKIIADPDNTLDEEREDNNVATRTMIVGEAPDMSRNGIHAISFNPSGFSRGDSVFVSFAVKNNGIAAGTAWARFMIYDNAKNLRSVDSVQFSLAPGESGVLTRKMLFDIDKGTVITEIIRCSPMEFDLLNNSDTLEFSTVKNLTANIVVTQNLDMRKGLPSSLPGWIGGKLILGDYDLVVNGTILNIDTAHFIITNGTGKLKLINGNAVDTFPVGTALYKPNFVRISNSGVADNFSVRAVPYVLKGGNNGDTIRTGNVNVTWHIEEDVPGGSNATVEFFWNATDELQGFDRNVARAAHYVTSWQLGDMAPATVISAYGQFSKAQTGYTSFSPFTVTSGTSTPLPLRLIAFTAVKQGSGAVLNWQTADENNTSHFVIQYSTNGQQFEDLGNVKAANTSGNHSYRFVHPVLRDGSNYYRLKMVDLDGSAVYSDIRLLKQDVITLLQVFPNPVQQQVTVKGIEANGILQVIAIDGKVVKQVITTGTSMVLNLGTLSKGIYTIQYSYHNATQQLKIVKE